MHRPLQVTVYSHRLEQLINIRLCRQSQAERGGTAAGGAELEGCGVVTAALLITGHKTGHHAVPRTDAVDDLIIKIGHAPRRKFKVVEKESCRESR